MTLAKVLIVAVAVVLNLSCNTSEGPLEKSGKKVDATIENLKDGKLSTKEKGPLEKAGEAVDDAVDEAAKKVSK